MVVQLNKNTNIVNNIVNTKSYIALKLKNNQRLFYNLLKANLQSYKQVIKKFLSCMRKEKLYKELKQLVSELTANNLRKRPLLDSWRQVEVYMKYLHKNKLRLKTKECQMCAMSQYK